MYVNLFIVKIQKKGAKKCNKMKNKFIINGKIFTKKYISGVQRFTLEIIRELDNIIDKDEIEICVPKCAKNIPNYKNLKIVKYSRLREIPWEQIAFPYYVAKNKGISINLGNVSPWINPGIVCIHDVNCIKNPRNFQKRMVIWYRFLFKRAMKKAIKIITVSDFCKREMLDCYNINENKIVVINNSWEHFSRIKVDDSIFSRYPQLKKEKFFFSIGTLTKHKNLEWVLKIAKENPKYYFAISGFVNIQKFKNELDLESPPNVIYLGYLSDEQVKAIYKKTTALLFPSLYEGFGLPPIEALSAGAKVVVADIECMHEIFEDTVLYINPYQYNIDLDKLLNQETARPEKILNKYSWRNSAQKLLNLIREEDNKIYEDNN